MAQTPKVLPQPAFGAPLVDEDRVPVEWAAVFLDEAYRRLGGQTDKVDQAYQVARAAVPQSAAVVAAGGLKGGGLLGGNVGVRLYVAVDGLANLPLHGNSEGDWAWAIDACKPGEASGMGTGAPVWWSNGAWYAITGAVVATSLGAPALGAASGAATTATAFAGNLLGYQYTSAGAAHVTLADNTTGPPNRCNVFVAGVYGSNVSATVLFPGQLIAGLGLTHGATIWLGAAGGMLTAPPASGFSQIIGDVDNAGNLYFNPGPLQGL